MISGVLSVSQIYKALEHNSDALIHALTMRGKVYQVQRELLEQDWITNLLLDDPQLIHQLGEKKIESHDLHRRRLAELSDTSFDADITRLAQSMLSYDDEHLRRLDTEVLEAVFGQEMEKARQLHGKYLLRRETYDVSMNRLLDRVYANVQQAEAGLHESNRATIVAISMTLLTGLFILICVFLVMSRRISIVHHELDEARLRSDYLADFRSKFLANMSHEIRTPLNGILGLSDWLEETELTEAQADRVKTLKSTGYNLLGIINNVLDLSKIEAGKFEPELIEFNVHNKMQVVIDMFMPLAQRKNLDLILQMMPSVPKYLRAHETVLQQAATNLLGNAIKFTDSGRVTTSVDFVDGMLLVSVEDTGIGMSREALEMVFEEFTQADVSTTRRFGGTGLGLAICKGLVELVNGELTAESILGRGSIFHLKIPVQEAQESALHRSESDDVRFDGMRVLVAEDNELNQFVIKSSLQRLGVICHAVSDGAAAVKKVQEESYDCAFFDYHMPNMDGYEAARVIRALGNDELVIFALSASVMDEDRRLAREAGMNGFLSKPLSKRELREALSEARRSVSKG